MKRSRISLFQLKMFDRLVCPWRRIDPFLPWRPTSLIIIGCKLQAQARVPVPASLNRRQSMVPTR